MIPVTDWGLSLAFSFLADALLLNPFQSNMLALVLKR